MSKNGLAKIGLAKVGLDLPCLPHLVSLLSFRNFSDCVGLCEPLFLLLNEESFIFLVVHRGTEEDAEKLHLTDLFVRAVFSKAQVVCVGQPMLVVGNLNADLVVGR